MDKTCFVIMPFSQTTVTHTEEYWTAFFQILKGIMNSHGYECNRSEVGPYKLFTNIANKIESSDLVIAVLTDFNANVWYELGMRHTLKNGTIMLLQAGQKAPFDIGDFGILFYDDTITIQQALTIKIGDYLSKINPDVSDSPIITALSSKRLKMAEQKNTEYEKLFNQLCTGKFYEEMKKMSGTNNGTKNSLKKALWLDEYKGKNSSLREELKDWPITFDFTCDAEIAIELYKTQKYDAVVVDVGAGSTLETCITFTKEIKLLGQRAYFIFCGNWDILNKNRKDLYDFLVPALTDSYQNVVLLLKDISEDKQYS